MSNEQFIRNAYHAAETKDIAGWPASHQKERSPMIRLLEEVSKRRKVESVRIGIAHINGASNRR